MDELYHYTDYCGKLGIDRDQVIKPTSQFSKYAHFGSGVYLSSIPPSEGTYKILRSNYANAPSQSRNPWTGNKCDYYFKFNADDLPGVRRVEPSRQVWLFPGSINLKEVPYSQGETRKTMF